MIMNCYDIRQLCRVTITNFLSCNVKNILFLITRRLGQSIQLHYCSVFKKGTRYYFLYSYQVQTLSYYRFTYQVYNTKIIYTRIITIANYLNLDIHYYFHIRIYSLLQSILFTFNIGDYIIIKNGIRVRISHILTTVSYIHVLFIEKLINRKQFVIL